MTTLDVLRNSLIDRIIATNNEKLLKAVVGIFESMQSEGKVKLSSEQIEMLMMSESDINRGKLISEDDLIKIDLEWLN